MHIFFYNVFITLFLAGIRIASLWNIKAALWVKGRKKFPELKPGTPCVWMHCASLGEFEQGRPVIESIRKAYPAYRIVVTFFSPSGYEIKKNYTGADAVFYLPADSPKNVKKFIDSIKPSLVIWIKYDYWYNYLTILKSRKIPVLLVSAIFRDSQPFFRWYGDLWRKMLHTFSHIFVQNEDSYNLVKSIVPDQVSLNGDTRFDRVIDIADDFQEIELVKNFCGNSRVIVAGSTWEEDEAQLVHFVKSRSDVKFIIAPHEITSMHLAEVQKKFKNSILFSAVAHDQTSFAQVLIIDNIGILSRLYKYATIAYVGGGFNSSGIHNTLEAAVYGVPVVFGPVYAKFEEAKAMIDLMGAFSFFNTPGLEKIFSDLLDDEDYRSKCGTVAKNYVHSNGGATQRILNYIAENRLLTN